MAPTDRRALVATLLAVVGATVGAVGVAGATVGVAGVGHVYLREWRRAIAWFALVAGTDLVLTAGVTDSLTAPPESLPLTVTVPILVLLSLSIFDAYYLGQRQATRGARNEGPVCPFCGGTVDPALDFCHWCTQPLVVDAGADATTDA